MELIAEIGPANGDLEYALEACEAAAAASFDWVKGQIYNRDTLVRPDAASYAHDSIRTPATQYEAFTAQLTYDEWEEVNWHCHQLGIGFFASVWDHAAVDFCEEIGVERYKIGSGDITYRALIEAVASTGKLVVLSTGASTEREIAQAVSWVGPSPLVLLACALSYPCAPEDAHIRRMETLRNYAPRVGYSDHTRGTGALSRAYELGADMLEKHFTVRPNTGGDHDFAVTPAEMGTDWDVGSDVLLGSPLLQPTPAEASARSGARRSLVLARSLPEGAELTRDDLTALRPGDGISPAHVDDFVGGTLRRAKGKHAPITYADI